VSEADAIETKLLAFERGLEDVLSTIGRIAEKLRAERDPHLRWLIAERLPALGSAVIPVMRKIYEDSDADRSLRFDAAWVSVRAGDRGAAVKFLCEEIDADTELSGPASTVLADLRLDVAIPFIQRALARADPTNTFQVTQFLATLKRLDGPLPDEVRARLVRASEEWVVGAIERDFPN
jgi:hypothetical protein